MAINNKETKTEVNTIEDQSGSKKKKRLKVFQGMKYRNFNQLLVITFFVGILLIISTYAWFSVSMNVRVENFDLVVSSDSGLFISLDGIEFSDSVEVSRDNVINDLKTTYSSHSNQWASGGLWPVSTNGISNSNSDKFSVFEGAVNGYIGGRRGDYVHLNSLLINEDQSNSGNVYITFDLFLKNVSGSPNPDNLYLDEGTMIDFTADTADDVRESMSGIMNSLRFGFLKIGSVPLDSEFRDIQNMRCNNSCEMLIYEPNNLLHSEVSAGKAKDYYGVTLLDGVYTPTYAVIKEGEELELANGHPESGIPLDTEHFALQSTITDFDEPIFTVPNAITKLRVYVWIEGQDLDSLETRSPGTGIDIAINFKKDLAGYE